MTVKLSPHFADYELKCKCSRHKDKPLCNVSPRLLMLAEKVRDVLKFPMIVTSCCRCAEHNAEVGGETNSLHICTEVKAARAMDFKTKGMTPCQSFSFIIRAWAGGGLNELGGIGLYDTWLHIDTAKTDDGHLRVWDCRKKKTAEDSEIIGDLIEYLRPIEHLERTAAVINRLCATLNEWRR